MRLKCGLILKHSDRKADAEVPIVDGDVGKSTSSDSGGFTLRNTDWDKINKWKHSLVKSCNVSDVLQDRPSPTRGLDAKVFLGKIKHSLLLKSQGSEFLMFGRPFAVLGSEISRMEKKRNDVTVLAVELRHEGALCELYVSGNKVYSTILYQTVPIAAHWYPGKTLGEPVLAASEVQALKNSSSGVLKNHRFAESLFAKLSADQRSVKFIAEYLGIAEAEAERIFVESPTFNLLYTASFPGREQVLPFGFKRTELYGNTQELLTMIDKSTALPLSIKIKAPHWQAEGVSNSADDGNWVLNTRVSVQPAREDRQYLEYTAGSVELKDAVPFDDQEAMRCLQRRVNFMSAIFAPQVPNFKWAESPCWALTADFDAAVLHNKEVKALLTKFLAQVTPARKANLLHVLIALFKIVPLLLSSKAGSILWRLAKLSKLGKINEWRESLPRYGTTSTLSNSQPELSKKAGSNVNGKTSRRLLSSVRAGFPVSITKVSARSCIVTNQSYTLKGPDSFWIPLSAVATKSSLLTFNAILTIFLPASSCVHAICLKIVSMDPYGRPALTPNSKLTLKA